MATDPRTTQAFMGLLTDHQEIIRSYIISQLPGCSEVRDILQDVNIFLWERMDDFKPGSNFGAWACTVAYYKILDYRKKQKKNGFLVFSEELTHTLMSEHQLREPDLLEAKRNALDYCLKKLTAKEKAILDARYSTPTGDMERMAKQTGRSRGSLRVTLSRLRAGLRNCISKRLSMEGDTL
ncbi:MAG: sigma-70 family RNA polymerase sigma factor [Verrucomicrobiae bacterium]|nr:sigma-70 family RNA polymerase sigma factor [Verrucomicrobiae bacterium]NNJ86695.1 sigma-70 family RNA polymerase sigma factor [Akkermansiaceae bacterium]